MRLAAKSLIAGAVLVTALILTLAMPIESWRTGRAPVPQIRVVVGGPQVHIASRLWIDTDAACGVAERADPDDCFAIALLARVPGMRIVGLSTIFGNAELTATDRTTRELAQAIASSGITTAPVYRGSSKAIASNKENAPGVNALKDALRQGPLTIIALGPLTNIAMALRDRPDLVLNVGRIVAVMGRQPGHIFHPAEGNPTTSLLGHGPVFRDMNFDLDRDAAAAILALGLPITLVPYDVARHVALTSHDLERLATAGTDLAWIVQRSQSWLRYWQQQIGRDGFYPFDLLAAAYVIEPHRFNCAGMNAWIAADDTLFYSWIYRRSALLVGTEDHVPPSPRAHGSLVYCPQAAGDLHDWLMDRFDAAGAGAAKMR